MVKYFSFLVIICSLNSYAKEVQFNCNFEREISLKNLTPLDAVVYQPTYSEKLNQQSYGFFIDSSKGKASYINYSHKIKRPMLIVSKSNKNITLVEDNTADDRFFVTLFISEKEGSFIPIVMNTHAWNPNLSAEFFAPNMSIGFCLEYK